MESWKEFRKESQKSLKLYSGNKMVHGVGGARFTLCLLMVWRTNHGRKSDKGGTLFCYLLLPNRWLGLRNTLHLGVHGGVCGRELVEKWFCADYSVAHDFIPPPVACTPNLPCIFIPSWNTDQGVLLCVKYFGAKPICAMKVKGRLGELVPLPLPSARRFFWN